MNLIIVLIIIGSLQLMVPSTLHAYWQVRSVDTMKMSRDMAKMSLDRVDYRRELRRIKDMGANYVAIATPYDKEFLPILRTWVDEAHRIGLNVWFRGNWSGWEGWYGYKKNISPSAHRNYTVDFIKRNPSLFRDGDSFTACPECEYGGPGSPLVKGNVTDFRNNIIAEQRAVRQAFAAIKKQVNINWVSMNADVARVVVNDNLLAETGNLITLDLYVRDPGQLDSTLSYFLEKFPNSQILMGEIGAPVPDVNGNMDEQQQARFIEDMLQILESDKFSRRIIGINYWVSSYGTTEIFNADGSERQAKRMLHDRFNKHSR